MSSSLQVIIKTRPHTFELLPTSILNVSNYIYLFVVLCMDNLYFISCSLSYTVHPLVLSYYTLRDNVSGFVSINHKTWNSIYVHIGIHTAYRYIYKHSATVSVYIPKPCSSSREGEQLGDPAYVQEIRVYKGIINNLKLLSPTLSKKSLGRETIFMRLSSPYYILSPLGVRMRNGPTHRYAPIHYSVLYMKCLFQFLA